MNDAHHKNSSALNDAQCRMGSNSIQGTKQGNSSVESNDVHFSTESNDAQNNHDAKLNDAQKKVLSQVKQLYMIEI